MFVIYSTGFAQTEYLLKNKLGCGSNAQFYYEYFIYFTMLRHEGENTRSWANASSRRLYRASVPTIEA